MSLWDQLWQLSQQNKPELRCPPLDPDLWRRTEKDHYLLHAANIEIDDLRNVVRQLTEIVESQAARIRELEK